MSDRKTPRAFSPAFDTQFENEESHVRGRRHGADTAPGRAAETVSERTARIEQKMGVATLLLERLSPLDPRARLLGSALFRRDEVLLDAILAQMTEDVVALVGGPRKPDR